MQDVTVQFHGPLYFAGEAGPCVFKDDLGKQYGVYLWAVPYREGGYIVTYVGETGVSFAKRLRDHMIQVMGGNYRFSDVERMKNGEEAVLWNGTWRKGTRDKMEEFLDHLPELAPKIQKYLRSVCLFVGPTKVDLATRRRIEGALAVSIRKSPKPYSSFYPEDNRYPVLKDGIQTFRLRIKVPAVIHGIPQECDA